MLKRLKLGMVIAAVITFLTTLGMCTTSVFGKNDEFITMPTITLPGIIEPSKCVVADITLPKDLNIEKPVVRIVSIDELSTTEPTTVEETTEDIVITTTEETTTKVVTQETTTKVVTTEKKKTESKTVWNGKVLNKTIGTVNGPSGKETYYNLNMSGVIRIMRNLGYDSERYPYYVRNDGVKMLGPYIMCAANLKLRPRGTIVETSLGKAIVCDTGEFAKSNQRQLDIAVSW